MPRRLRKCSSCGKYTLAMSCSVCSTQTKLAHPPKFSIQDKYARFRRVLRRER